MCACEWAVDVNPANLLSVFAHKCLSALILINTSKLPLSAYYHISTALAHVSHIRGKKQLCKVGVCCKSVPHTCLESFENPVLPLKNKLVGLRVFGTCSAQSIVLAWIHRARSVHTNEPHMLRRSPADRTGKHLCS